MVLAPPVEIFIDVKARDLSGLRTVGAELKRQRQVLNQMNVDMKTGAFKYNVPTPLDTQRIAEASMVLRSWGDITRDAGISGFKLRQGVIGMGMEVNKQGQFVDKASKQVLNYEHSLSSARSKAMTPFRGEWLSVMFVGMAIQKMFGGMISQILELAGVFDVWRATLISILGPVLFPLSQILIKIMI